jgi:hypothetical protein
MTAWHGGKGSNKRRSSISRKMLDLRDALWRALEKDKPSIVKQIEKLEAEEAKSFKGTTMKTHSIIFHADKPALEGSIRTEQVEGHCSRLPKVGEMFCITAVPLTKGATFRHVNTSTVTEVVVDGNVYSITTLSGSKYRVEVTEYTSSKK